MEKRDPEEIDENCGRIPVLRKGSLKFKDLSKSFLIYWILSVTGSSSRKFALQEITKASLLGRNADTRQIVDGPVGAKRACVPPSTTLTATAESRPLRPFPERGGSWQFDEREYRHKLLSSGMKRCPATVALLKLADEARISVPLAAQPGGYFGESDAHVGNSVCSSYLVAGQVFTAGHRTQLVEFLVRLLFRCCTVVSSFAHFLLCRRVRTYSHSCIVRAASTSHPKPRTWRRGSWTALSALRWSLPSAPRRRQHRPPTMRSSTLRVTSPAFRAWSSRVPRCRYAVV